MVRLSPLVTRRKRPELLIDYYKHVSDRFLNGDDEQKATYREKLLGPDLIAGVPDEYAVLSIVDKLGHDVWHSLTLEEQGMYIAYYRIENMTELLRQHLQLLKREEEEAFNKRKGKT